MFGNPLAGQGLLTSSQNPWLVMLGNAIRGGLAGVAAGRGTKGFGAGLGVGSVAGVQSGYEAQQNQRRNAALQQQIDYQNSEIELRKQAAAEKAADQQRVEAFISSLPPEQQGMARLAPKEVIAQQLKQMYPDEPGAPKTVGGMQWNSATKAFEEIPGYTGQAKAIAEATRAPRAVTNINMPKTIEERDQQVLLGGNPASPEYAMAYTRTFQNPRFVQGTDASGQQTMVPIMPAVPPNIRKPTYMGGGAAGGSPAAGAGAASGTGPTPGQPIVTGVGQANKAMTAEATKKRLSLDNLDTSIKQYEAELKKTGATAWGAAGIPTGDNMKLSSAYTSLLLELKELYNLGVLNGPDYELMQKSIQNPNSIRGYLATTPAMLEQLSLVKSKLAQAKKNIEIEYGPSRISPPVSAGPVIWKRDASGELVREGAQ